MAGDVQDYQPGTMKTNVQCPFRSKLATEIPLINCVTAIVVNY